METNVRAFIASNECKSLCLNTGTQGREVNVVVWESNVLTEKKLESEKKGSRKDSSEKEVRKNKMKRMMRENYVSKESKVQESEMEDSGIMSV